MVSADSDTRDGAIGEEEDRSDGIHMFLDLCRNALLVELVLLKATDVGQSRGVEDTNLAKGLCAIIILTNASAYHYAVLAGKLVNARGGGLALVGRTTLLVGMVENVEVITSSVIPSKNIGD